MGIEDIVNVSITLATGGKSKTGFGVLNIAGFHLAFTPRIQFYSNIAAVAEDFETTALEYKAANAYFSQNPRPTSLAISRLQVDAVTVTPVAVNTTTYTTTINGTAFQFVSDADATAAEISLGLVTAINLGAEPVTAADLVGTYDLTADVAGTAFTLGLDTNQSYVVKTEGDASWTAGLNAIELENDAWYGLAIISRTVADQLLAAAWAEARTKIFGLGASAAAIADTTAAADTTTVVAQLKAAGYARTFSFYHTLADGSATDQWIECAAFSKLLSVDPDVQTQTLKFKTMAGITVDTLTSTQRLNIIGTEASPTSGKNGNIYTAVKGENIIQSGIVAAGEWIDIIEGRDWLKTRMEEDIYGELVNELKIPYTAAGLAVIGGLVRKRLQLGIGTQFLAFDDTLGPQGFLVTVPDINDVTAADKANRILTGVQFSATAAGAIHAVTITGTISV
jgi:hypothetical protein